MAYTNAWDVTTPPGTTAAKLIDDHFRRLRLDLQERLLAVFVNMAADPLVVRDEVRGVKTGKKLMVPGASFKAKDPDGTLTYNNGLYVDIPNTAGLAVAAVILPVGVSIKKVRWLVACGDATATTFALCSSVFSTGATRVVENTQTKSSSGIEIKDSGAISVTVDGTKYFWLEADRSGGSTFQIYAVEITYDTPDSRSTM